MPNIPQINIGGTVYKVKDERIDKMLDAEFFPMTSRGNPSRYIVRCGVTNIKYGEVLDILAPSGSEPFVMTIYTNSNFDVTTVIRAGIDNFTAMEEFAGLWLEITHKDTSKPVTDAEMADLRVVKYAGYAPNTEFYGTMMAKREYSLGRVVPTAYVLQCLMYDIKAGQRIHLEAYNDIPSNPLGFLLSYSENFESGTIVRSFGFDDFIAPRDYNALYIRIIRQDSTVAINETVRSKTYVEQYFDSDAIIDCADQMIADITHRVRYSMVRGVPANYTLRCEVVNAKAGQILRIRTPAKDPMAIGVYPSSNYWSSEQINRGEISDFYKLTEDYDRLYIQIAYVDTSKIIADYFVSTTFIDQYYDIDAGGAYIRVNGKTAGSSGNINVYGNDIDLDEEDNRKVGESVQNLLDMLPYNSGVNGQVLKTNGDGTTEWSDASMPTPQQIGDSVASWLDAHPEATTSLQDGQVSYPKLDQNLQGQVTKFSKRQHKTVYVDEYESLVQTIIHPNGRTYKDWSPAIQAAIDAADIGGMVLFSPGKTYRISHGVTLKKGQTIEGNGATLKRNYPIRYELSAQLRSDGTVVNLTQAASLLKAGDVVHVFDGASAKRTSGIATVRSVSDNMVTLTAAIGKKNRETSDYSTYDAGSTLAITYAMISCDQYPVPVNAKIYNLIFDGDSDEYDGFNGGNFYWYLNCCLYIFGYGSEVAGCQFLNMPNECICTHGAHIHDNFASNLDGSFVHLSCPKTSLLDPDELQYINTTIANNIVVGSNKALPDQTLHSLAVIEQSWNGGNINVIGNRFTGSGNGRCYNLATEIDESTGVSGFSNVVIVGNYYYNYEKISDAISASGKNLSGKLMSNNIFRDCGTTNLSAIGSYSQLGFSGNVYVGNTVVTAG